jgi:hypothetical protein
MKRSELACFLFLVAGGVGCRAQSSDERKAPEPVAVSEPPSPPPPPPEAPSVPTKEDFEDEAATEIAAKDIESELEKLSRELQESPAKGGAPTKKTP